MCWLFVPDSMMSMIEGCPRLLYGNSKTEAPGGSCPLCSRTKKFEGSRPHDIMPTVLATVRTQRTLIFIHSLSSRTAYLSAPSERHDSFMQYTKRVSDCARWVSNCVCKHKTRRSLLTEYSYIRMCTINPPIQTVSIPNSQSACHLPYMTGDRLHCVNQLN